MKADPPSQTMGELNYQQLTKGIIVNDPESSLASSKNV